jgi:hypothetical protein
MNFLLFAALSVASHALMVLSGRVYILTQRHSKAATEMLKRVLNQ